MSEPAVVPPDDLASRAVAEADADDLGLLRRQVELAMQRLLQPGTYVGTVKELLLTTVHLAAYPLGVMRADERGSTPYRPLPVNGDLPDAATAAMPVILLHGYVHNRSAFFAMSRALRRAGFRHVHGFDYNPLANDIPDVADLLAAEVERVLERAEAERCMIVGHSMGGVVARYYVQQLGGDERIDTVLTLGTPHRGTYASYLGIGPATRQLQPGSALLRELEESARPSPVRWLAYYSDLDFMVVPAANARLLHPALQATNVKLADTGHLSLLLSGAVLRRVVTHLSDRTTDRPARRRTG